METKQLLSKVFKVKPAAYIFFHSFHQQHQLLQNAWCNVMYCYQVVGTENTNMLRIDGICDGLTHFYFSLQPKVCSRGQGTLMNSIVKCRSAVEGGISRNCLSSSVVCKSMIFYRSRHERRFKDALLWEEWHRTLIFRSSHMCSLNPSV